MNPEKLGPYHIDDEVGRGGMGVVYRATHQQTGRHVAIKVLPAELARDPGFADRFAREIATLQRLDHPNIVKLIEPGEDAGYQYYVMEYVAGKSLDKVIKEERRIPWVRSVELGVQICRGLKHAHDHGVIHRDLKPGNLLVTDDGTIKLTDFGIAKVFAGTHLTATGGIIGTAEYMSPEQGEGKPITRRSDLYSLGVVLYAMLTGRTPFIGRSVAELINLHRFGQFDRPMALVPEIPSWLDELVRQLLEKDPEKRPPDAHVVGRRLESVQKKVVLRSALTVLEGDPTVIGESTGPRRRRGMGPATLMQRLMRAQLREIDEPGWIGHFFQKTWVLVLALLMAVGALTAFTLSGGEKRRWNAVEKLISAGDERDAALLSDRLQDYLRRHATGPHAEEARKMLPEFEQERRRREFARSAAVKDLRPRPEPTPELERLYRKALLQLWTEGEAAARATFEEILRHRESDESDQFIVGLASEDLMSLELQRATQLQNDGQIETACRIWQRIIDDYGESKRYSKWTKYARDALANLDAAAETPPKNSGNP